jgi:SAM-dependent methyltransferase
MPWDAGGAPRSLERFLRRGRAPGRVLIPGCGSGYEVKAFRKFGWDVLAVDFSREAVRRARKIVGPRLRSRIIYGDFFRTPQSAGEFDLIYERRFLCSMPPKLWRRYAKRCFELLKPGGKLAGFFFYGREDEPPPYPLTKARARRLFLGKLKLTADRKAAGGERWQQWIKRVASP